MREYEGIFIFPPESAPEARKAQLKGLDDVFAKFGVEVLQRNEWGRKQLGYPIRKFNDGHFLVIEFRMDSTKGNEFRKALELQEDLMKYVITVRDLIAEKKQKAAAAKRASAAPAPAAVPSVS